MTLTLPLDETGDRADSQDMTFTPQPGLVSAYERSIDMIADDLRKMAERIERKKHVSGRIQRPYSANATEVVSDILNMLPNLRLTLLIERANDVENYPEENV